tara:strand:- start:1837 stop:3591 length:1755 start_codon:yes stop_codon:yes gene_type:complete
MALTREERKLLHQKSNQPTLGSGVPNSREGNEGDVAYRNVKGSGVVQYLKTNNEWVAVSSSGEMPQTRTPISNRQSVSGGIGQHGSLTGLGSDHHTQYLLISGTRAMSGGLNMGSQSITSVASVTASGTVQAEQLTSTDDASIADALDVDGHTTLDQVTIDTADGAFAVSGANPISLTTTGSNDINITTAQTLDVGVSTNYELSVDGNCDWDTADVDWDNSATFDLRSIGNITIHTDGRDADTSGNDDASNTILIRNANSNNSNFTGIHIKTDSQGAANSHNDILIECANVAAKGSTYGVDIRSLNNIRIRAENTNAGTATGLLMRATGPVDIGVGASLSPHTSKERVLIHGTYGIDFATLYRDSGDPAINTTNAKWDKIDTYNLVRAMTYRTSTTVVWETDTTCHVTSGDSTVTHDANTRILKGQKVTGTGIPADTFVGDGGTPSDFTSTQFILVNSSGVSVNATAGDGSEITLQFFNPSTIEEDNSIGIVNKDNDDNALGTVWQITVYYTCSSTKKNLQIFYLYFTSSSSFDKYTAVEDLHSTAAGVLNWDSNQGITWQNEDTQDATVRASALRIQSGTNDF